MRYYIIVAILLIVSIAPASAQNCQTDNPLFTVGQTGRVTEGDPNNVRSEPTTSGTLLGAIAGGDSFTVLDGPRCANGYVWWQVERENLIGWTVEGDGTTFWLESVSPPITLDNLAQLQPSTVDISIENLNSSQISVSEDATLLAFDTSFDIVIWDISTQAILKRVDKQLDLGYKVAQLAFSPNNRYIATRFEGPIGHVGFVYDRQLEDHIVQFDEPYPILDFAFTRDSQHIFVAGNQLERVSLATSERTSPYKLPHASSPQMIEFISTRDRLLFGVNSWAGEFGGRLYEWNYATGLYLGYTEFEGTREDTHVTYHIALDAAKYYDERIIAVDSTRTIRIIQSGVQTVITEITIPRYKKLVFPPQDVGFFLLITPDNESMWINLQTGERTPFITLEDAVFTTEGDTLFTVGEQVQMWQVNE